MRLKKLELYGFKSFAEKISLNFEADIIALVGPNGCGKSNIVDAILWVLGEQSARSLRAEKMQDVLFAGTDDLKPFNIAEVSLTFTEANSDFGDEITITRRVYRDGETQYLINKKEVRLKDVQELFLGSGIGKNGLFVFEQGRIDEIINLTPEKRRVIFEETAGISRFLQKKKESVSKLVEVDQNYHRLKDLHIEVEKQYRTLQKQAAKAKTYKESKDLLDELEKSILAFKITSLNRDINELESRQKENDRKLTAAEVSGADFEKTQVELKKAEEEFEREKSEIQQKYFHVKTAIKLIDVELKAIEEATTHLESREKKALTQKDTLALVGQEKALEKEEREKEFHALDEERKIVEKEKKGKEVALDDFEKKISSHFLEEKRQQKLLLEEIQKESILSNKVQERELKIDTLIVSDQALTGKIKERRQHFQAQETKIGAKKEEVSKLLRELEREKRDLISHEKKGEEIHEKMGEKNREKEDLTLRLLDATSKEKALLQLQEEHAGFSNGAKELLKEAKGKKSPLFGKVEELYKHLQVETGKNLSFYEEALLVKNRHDLEAILNFATKKKLGDFSILLLDDLAEFKKAFLTDDLVQDLETALRIREKKKGEIFTDFGFHINRYGVFFYRSQEKSLFSRLNEIKQLKKVIGDLEKRKQDIEGELNVLISLKKEWESSRLQLEEKRQKKEMTLLQENFFLQRLIEDQKDTEVQIEKLEKEKGLQLQVLSELKESIKGAVKELESAKKGKEKIKATLSDFEIQIKEMRQELGVKIRDVNEIKAQLEKISSKLQGVKEKVRVFEIRQEEEKKEEKRLSKELSEIAVLKNNYHEKKQHLMNDRENYESEKGVLEKKLTSFDDVRRSEKERKKEVDAQLSQVRKDIKELEKEKHKIDLLLAEKKTANGSLLEKCPFDLTNVHFDKDFSLVAAEKQAYHLRFELENSTVISLSAIDECKEQEKRFVELDKQLKDIASAKADLEKIILKLEKESRSLLKTTFELVRKHFQKNFKILFNGGEADLSFTSQENLLESGVEILARPPGKKMRSLSLLSGGEKCLTTLALLFALFEVKPAPFCILDEVDAPLDEVNVTRFTSLLKEFVSKTQFLIVTHNKKTMAVADTLVGVSMEKRGISKLVSLGFSKKSEKLQEITT